MKGLGIEEDLGQDIAPKIGSGLKEMAMGKDMVPKKRKGQISPIDKMEPKVKLTIPPKNQQRVVNIFPMKGTGNRQDENGGDKDRDDKRKFRNSKYDFENKKDEESDTEDSCELEITPKQLSQVVPGGGELKIKLSKNKPIKITVEAPDGEPDPAQTKVKTVHDPMNRGDGQLISSLKPGVVVGVGQSVEMKIPLGGIIQPMLRMSRKKDLTFHLKELVDLTVMTMGPQIEMGTSMTMAIA